MATVPGVLVFGGYMVNGGQPGLNAVYSATLTTTLSSFLDRELMQITPCHATTGAPTADSISCWPWYDQTGDDYANLLLVASSTTTTATCTLGGVSPGWTVNEHVGRMFTVNWTTPFPGKGFAQRLVITANTADTVTFALTTAPVVGAIAFVGIGKFRDYHPAGGHLHSSEAALASTRGGSTGYANGQGVGPDATLVRRLLEDVYDTAPYFHLFKFATTGSISTSWGDSPHDASRTTLTAELTRVAAAATARGNTIDWQHVVIDSHDMETIAAISSPANILLYKDSLEQFIAWLQTAPVLNSSSIKFHIVLGSNELYTVTGAGAIDYLRARAREVAQSDDAVRLIDMQGAKLGKSADTPAAEAEDYAQEEYFRLGELMSESIRRANLGTVTEPSQGFPVYLMIGDSICAGPATQAWVLASNSMRISGPTVGQTLRPSNQKVWNRGSLSLEVYEPGVNSNTSATISAASGPDLSLMAQLGDLHPDGFALVKRGSNGSTLATNSTPYNSGTGGYGAWIPAEAEHYPEMLEDLAQCFQYVNETTGKQVDMRGIVVILGTNDGAQSGGGAAFSTALEGFCETLWEDVATRTSGPRPPIVWVRPQLGQTGGITVELNAIRLALARFAQSQDQFRVVDVDDLERDRGDNLHQTPDGAVECGDRIFAAMQRIALA